VKTLHALPPIKDEADLTEAARGEGVVELIRVVLKDDVDAFHSGETHNTVEVRPMPMVLSRAALLRSKRDAARLCARPEILHLQPGQFLATQRIKKSVERMERVAALRATRALDGRRSPRRSSLWRELSLDPIVRPLSS
jgi:hypothetical protein